MTAFKNIILLAQRLQLQCSILLNNWDTKLIWRDSITTLIEWWATSDVLHAYAFSLVAKWCK